MTKFVCISDTHTMLDQISVPDGDVLIHAGDATYRGTVAELAEFNKHLGAIKDKFRHIVYIPGNHDFAFQQDERVAKLLMTNCEVLIDEAFEVDGIKIWGSPWQPWFYDWAFNLTRGMEIQKKWDLIPDDSDIVVTHGPVMGFLDRTTTGEHVGCGNLLTTLHERVRPKYHICGHIHEARGIAQSEHTTFVNASVVNRRYNVVHKPIIFDFDK